MDTELAIYFANTKALNNMEEALRFVDLQKAPTHLAAILFSLNSNMTEYVGNVNSIQWLDHFFRKGIDFSRLYFGQEFCQNLIPPADEIEESYYYSRQLNWNYTYVTGGYLVEKSIEKVRRNLDKLLEIGADDVEVVFNDWGVFRMLQREYSSFKPVMGRILNKSTRLDLFTMPPNDLPILMANIQSSVEDIHKNQLEAYADNSLSNPSFYKRLLEWGVKNVDMDMLPQGIKRPEDGWGMTLGLYFPWGFVATGRSCPTAGAVEQPRGYRMMEKPCPRPCQKFNCSPNIQPVELPLMQRGPTLFSFHSDIAEQYFDGKIPYERLIYQPYIPL